VNRPLISVILGNYNHGRYLGQAIDAVLSQDYENLEVCIRDNASTDNSREVIEAFSQKDSRIRATLSKERLGINDSARELVSSARGELLYLASSDDYVSNPSMFGECVRLLNEDPAGAVFGRMRELRADNNDEPLWLTGHAHREGPIRGMEFIEGFFRGTIQPVTTPSLIRKDAYLECGGLDPKFGPSADMRVMALIGATRGLIYVEREYACYRIQQMQYSRSQGYESYIEQLAGIEADLCEAMLPSKLPNEWRSAFRERWIDYRLRAGWQADFLRGLSSQIQTLDYWKLHYLPPAYRDLRDSIQRSIDSSIHTLNDQIRSGREIFARIAGPL
jgi:glycosyltransferase involved in cell wall biosynthesis